MFFPSVCISRTTTQLRLAISQGYLRKFATNGRLMTSTISGSPEVAEQLPPAAESGDSTSASILSVDDLKATGRFDKHIINGMKKSGFDTLTPVQQETILPILDEKNGMVVRAKTGTGKTLAFVVPTLQSAIESAPKSYKHIRKTDSLIVAPTRDLAMQIQQEYFKVLKSFPKDYARSKVSIELIIGGKSTKANKQNPPSIAIATPGKLEARLRNPNFASMFENLNYRIYDEADRILDQGFAESLSNIDRSLKNARKISEPMKSVLFSATVDEGVSLFAKSTIGNNYKFIDCVKEDEPEAHENIHQALVKTDSIYESFNGALTHLAENVSNDNFKAIVFLPTIKLTDWFHSVLQGARYKNLYGDKSRSASKFYKLHGQMSQAARDRTVREYRTTPRGVLVCTDVAARGLDLKDVSEIIQMGPSISIADYIHKIGRTARAGKKGKAIIFLSKYENNFKEQLHRERDVEFAEELTYQDIVGEEGDLFRKFGIDENEVVDFMDGFLNFHKQLNSIYRFPRQELLPQVFGFYRELVQDPMAKLVTSNMFLKNAMNISPQEATKYFEVPGGIRYTQSNNRQSKKTFYGGSKQRGGYQGGSYRDRSSNDRGGYRDRSSNDRGGFNDRSGGYKSRNKSRDWKSKDSSSDRY
ncbi:uncharacterized protein PRCAT00002897001 [Priceomyces carsonii]|uniref:uncharacterized protein n=1 Tax=Priceomyces carsonii TaxID=28549 RepID=UPI002EDB0899|nr:unnamed protein product [Priceomyces carsonii]